MVEQVVDPTTQITMEVVDPGSPEDPFKGTSAAPPSADVSTEGATQEPQTQTEDGTTEKGDTAAVEPKVEPTEAPSITPEAPVLPVQSGVVEVIPPVAVEPVPPAPTEVTKTAEVKPAAAEPITEESAKVLQEAIKSQVDEALRGQQSTNDQRASKLEKSMQDAQAQNKNLTDQIRELETRDLTDEEKQKVQDAYAQKDERAELDTYREELSVVNSSLYVQALVLDYETFGVKKEQLEAFKTPEEMDVYCLEAKASFLEKKLAEVPVAKAEAAPTTKAPAPTTEEPPKVETPAVAQVPAAAQVATDMGSPGAAQTASKFSEEATPEALRENLKAAGWSTVRLRG